VQLKHEQETTFISAIIAAGVAFIIFGLTVVLNAVASGISPAGIPLPIQFTIYVYSSGGAILFSFGLVRLSRLKSSTEKALEKLREKYATDW